MKSPEANKRDTWQPVFAGTSIGIAMCLLLAFAGAGVAQHHPMMAGDGHLPTTAGGGHDTRKPLPLTATMAEHQKQNMRDHLAAVQAMIAALAREDMAGVSTASGRIGFSEAMGQMCEHMGAAAPGFHELAISFHHTADTIGAAARNGDRAGVLSALDRTLQTCVICHSAYRQEVVDEETWKRLVESATQPTP